MKDIKSSNRHNPEVLDRSVPDARPAVKTRSSMSSQDIGESQPAVRVKPARSIQERNTSVPDRTQTEQLEHAGAQELEHMPPEAQQTTIKREMDAQPGTDVGQPIIPYEQAIPNASSRREDDEGEQLKGYQEHAGVQEPTCMSPRVCRTVHPTESAVLPQADVKHLAARERHANVPEQLRRSIRTRDSVVLPDNAEEQPVIRTKPSKDNREHSATIQNRSQSQPVGGHMPAGSLQGTGSAPFTAAAMTVGIGRAAGAVQGAVNTTVSVQPEQTSPSEPTLITPQTRRAIQQVSVTLAAQSARIARQSAVSAAQAVTGKPASSQPSSRRNNPSIKGTQTLKLMKRGVVQAGRSIKYAANKTADQLSRDPSASRGNPDKAASDLAIRQAQALAARVAQAASRRAAQAAGRVAAKVSAQAARLAAKAVVYLAQVAAKAVSALLAAAGPVGVVIVVVVLAAIIALLLLSPMGIFAGGGGNGTPNIAEIAQTLNGELSAKIAHIQQQVSPVDEIQIVYEGSEDNTFISNWPDVLSVFAVKVNMNAEDPLDVVVMDEVKQGLLREVFWDMNSVSYTLTETDVPQPSQTPQVSASPTPTPSPSPSPTPVRTSTRGPIMLAASKYAWDDVPEPVVRSTSTAAAVHKSLEINVNSRSYSEMEDVYHFTEEQRRMLQELMGPDMQSLFYNLVGKSPGASLTPDQINQIRARLPEGLDVQREQIALAAYSLVGKVDYFWGGKSLVVGWDERWGKPRKVTSKGNPTTGTLRPFGLDCSGFVAWTFINGGFPKDVIQDAFGTGSSVQWKYSVPIKWEEIMPGDVVFYNPPGTAKGNHVGVCVGFDSEDEPLIAHSPRTGMRVTVSEAHSAKFKYARRPVILLN